MINHLPENADPAASDQHKARNKDFRDTAKEALHKVADKARDAGEQARRATSDATSTVADQVMDMLNEQVGVGAQSASQFASSMKLAANDMARENPVLAGLVSGLADNVARYADRLEGKTVKQLSQSASDFTRRQPALTVGLAAIAGFFAFRTFKNAGSMSSPPIQPHEPYTDAGNG
jgi:ElaB/YqjD/DUF883 family membrane-anchored ribosome-binding protein